MQQQPDGDGESDQRRSNDTDLHAHQVAATVFLRPEEAAEGTDREGHQTRALQALVVNAEAPVVFRQAGVHQLVNVDLAVAELGRAVDGEVVVLLAVPDIGRNANALPHQKGPHRGDLQFEPRTAPERHVAAMPGDPVHEEQDVAAFFMHDGLEGIDQIGGKRSRSPSPS